MNEALTGTDETSLIAAYRARTPARVLAGQAGTGYRSETLLGLRADHAFARDAVHAELDLERDLGRDLVECFGLFLVQTEAGNKEEYLKRPDVGRRLHPTAQIEIAQHVTKGADFQLVIGDGLSPIAVARQVPQLLPRLIEGAKQRGWIIGQPFAVRYCRVGVLNDIGDLLDAAVIVLLIGERPGLATSESLSAYMAYRPRAGHTDADRNLISNIHSRGVAMAEATSRILDLAVQMLEKKASGVAIKERLGSPQLSSLPLESV